MAVEHEYGEMHQGWKWGPFVFRVPFYHVRVEWQELLQGIFVAGATGLALVPLLTAYFGLTFQESVAMAFLWSILLSSQPILFGEPFAPGWITPALPLVLNFVLPAGGPIFDTPAEGFQLMTAMTINFSIIVLIMGATGLGPKLVERIPSALKGGIIMGAGIAALYRVFISDENLFQAQPVTTTVSVAVCVLLIFSIPIAKYKAKRKWLAVLASTGLLPGFLAAAFIGPFTHHLSAPVNWLVQQGVLSESWSGYFVKEMTYNVNLDNPILLFPFGSLIEKVSPFSIGWPDFEMFFLTFPLGLIGYVILFGDLITGVEVLKTGMHHRPDEKIDINLRRAHYSVTIRNVAMALLCPFFPTQGCLWTGVQVIVVQRWVEGKKAMQSFFSGTASYYVFGIPVLYMVEPLLRALEPLFGIALSLTLVLTGFACSYVSMSLQKTNAERGAVVLMGAVLAFFANPWIGMTVAVITTLALVGFSDPTVEEEPPSVAEHDPDEEPVPQSVD